MTGDRYVVLGLGRPRAEWFRAVGQWATSAAIPAEFSKCVSVEELRARLAAGRPYSAVLVDGGIPAVDRDLLHAARDAGCAVLVVDDGAGRRDWVALGASAVLPLGFSRELLIDTLASRAHLVGRGAAALDEPTAQAPDAGRRGALATVCGPGGTGASTVAAALAQGLGHRAPTTGPPVLADLALRAEQAMLHDVRDLVPGVQELVEAHRAGHPSADDVRALTFEVVERRYHLLLGLRRARYWSTLRLQAFTAALDSLRGAFPVVVADVTGDFEGEDDAGSADVEERNLMARAAVQGADAVFAVGRPGVKGVHALVRLMGDLAAVGVPAGRVVPVVNLAPRHPRARATVVAALAELSVPAMGGGRTASPVFLPTRRVEEALRDAVPLPAPLPGLLAGAWQATFDRLGPAPAPGPVAPQLVRPGTIGSWFPDADGTG